MRGMSPPPLPPKSIGLPSLGRAHLRKRSLQASNTAAEVESLMAGHGASDINLRTPRSADDTVVEFGEDDQQIYLHHVSDKYKHGDKGFGDEDDSAAKSPRNPGHLMWQDKQVDKRRKNGARCLGIFFLIISAFFGWIIGIVAPPRSLKHANQLSSGRGNALNDVFDLVSGQEHSYSAPPSCNPYDEYGILNVSTNVAAENVWQPIAPRESCQPIDYMLLFREAIESGETSDAVSDDLAFAVNRTVVIYGDSVDRDHNVHFCSLVGGYLEMIGVNHTLSPPYPPGDEIPPEGYKNYATGAREWPEFDQSRPYICHVGHLGLRILSVFHYGFRGRTKMIESHPHFYPPATIEERFDQIVVPLVHNLAAKHNVSATPDLVSFTPGYWGLLRQAVSDDKMLLEALKNGTAAEEAQAKYDVWRTMSPDQREWNRERMNAVLRHIGRGWLDTAKKASDGAARTPRILWRALHHIKEQHNLPYNRVQAVDQIGRSVVQQLIAEGRAAVAGSQTWTSWIAMLKNSISGTEPDIIASEEIKLGSEEEQKEAFRMGYAHRLKIDEWGALMIGQERYFRDNVHPLPLPGSYLYGNMLMQQLKMLVEEEELPVPIQKQVVAPIRGP
ncbi:hypothetical protein MVLG_01776 [Microbotryum lychnidis-dioicae p1A1 Lamole]|uniref:Uncharacterized protein n=1 Tax=Microbotryum lychnidis-dioicae (strain p1A1 Lamole / MvSl-1064) TaxID=683840 RepID=U5H350_USTV1|nr:hypothetical protein MVLG_01776 [Microbotryum lychnidis-dioicae p1A1 Lamole]|eukprot:KDE08076.1 hypothetical protein MVLG_01776 [Microbotryum lychnidis-dioicae p1A1 Lamole]